MDRVADTPPDIQSVSHEADRKHRSDFLNLINKTFIALHILVIVSVIANFDPGNSILSLFFLAGNTLINVFIYKLNKNGHVNIASFLYCLDFNLIIIFSFIFNMYHNQYALANIFAMMFAIIPLFIAVLINTKYVFAFTFFNVIFISGIYWYFFDEKSEIIRQGFPVLVFILMITMIAWLYQKTLVKSMQRLQVARTQMTKDVLLKQELEIARELQNKLYPPPPDSLGAVHIAAKAVPAMETSGDLYDFIHLDQSRIGIVVADVTGKSMAAALMMAMARSIFRSEARRSLSAGEVLTNVNTILCADTSIKQMITAWYGILDTRTLTLRFANAGHPFALLRRQGVVRELEAFGLPLRALSSVAYAEETIVLQPGDCVLLHTDGVVEMMNAQRELFSFERLAASLQQGGDTGPDGVLAHIQTTLDRFRGASLQHDDLTLVVVSVDGALQ